MRFYAAALSLGLFVGAPHPASAQFDTNLASQLALQRQTTLPLDGARMRSRSLARGRAAAVSPGTPAGATPAAPAEGFSARFRRSSEVAARVRARYVDYVRQTAGDDAARLVASDFKRIDPAVEWSRAMREAGLPGASNDMAEAFAGYWLLNWAMANQQDVSAAQARGVLQQTYRQMSANPRFAKLGDAGRQEFADALMCSYIYQQTAFRTAAQKGDKALLRRLSDAAEARFRRELGMDLRAMRLTPAGLKLG